MVCGCVVCEDDDCCNRPHAASPSHPHSMPPLWLATSHAVLGLHRTPPPHHTSVQSWEGGGG